MLSLPDFRLKFKDKFVPSNSNKDGYKSTLKYKSYADYSAGGELEFKNNVNFWNVMQMTLLKRQKI